MSELATKIKEFIMTEVNPDANLTALADDEPLVESGLVDSLGVLKILAYLDEAFGVDLSSAEIKLENFRTVQSICALVERGQAS
jgi:acyl carrier protein